MTEFVPGTALQGTQVDKIIHCISKPRIEIERAVIGEKWFEYRFMNPVRATYLYTHHYRNAWKEAFSKMIDSRKAFFIDPVKKRNFFQEDPTFAKAMWYGRQTADAMGMPYDVYLERAFHWVLRYWRRSHLPTARQLYSDLVIDRVPKDWDELQAARLFYSERPEYLVENYVGNKFQDDHQAWLCKQSSLRANSSEIAAWFISKNLLLPKKAEEFFGADKFNEIKSFVN